MKKLMVLVVLAFGYVNSDRIYESECPAVTPMQDFDMQRVSENWVWIFIACWSFEKGRKNNTNHLHGY